MKKQPPVFETVFWGCLILSKTLFAQFDVLVDQMTPTVHSIDAEVHHAIQIPFNLPVDLNRIDEKVFITGKLTGGYEGNFSLDSTHRILIFQTARPYHPGERIDVLLTGGVASASGVSISAPFQWSFQVGAPQGAGDFEKYPSFSLNGESTPYAVCTADLNRDGFVDLVTANNATNSVSVLRNDFQSARGGFYVDVPFSVGSGPMTVRSADINQDGLLDLVVPNFFDNTITVLRNAGHLAFYPFQLLDVMGTRPIDLILEDFNNDRLTDMAVALFGSDSIEVFMNTGGALNPSTGVRLNPSGVVALAGADVDRDGDKDIIAACWGSMSLICLENVSGTFRLSQTIALDFSPSAVIAANLFNVDAGEMDILCTGQNSDQHAIVENVNGILQPPAYLPNPELPVHAVCGNYSGTSQRALSLAAANLMDGEVHVFENDGFRFNSQRVNRVDANPAPMGLGQADFDLDGDIDLIVTNVQDDQVTWLENIYSPDDFYIPRLDFDDVCVGHDSVATVEYVNTTSVVVTLYDVSLTDPTNFSVDHSPFPVSVFPNDTIPIDVAFHPTGMQFYHEGLVIETDYIHVSSITVALYGQGIDVILSPRPADLNFGVVPPGMTGALSVELVNNGNAEGATFLDFSDPHFYTDRPGPFLAPAYGESQPISIFFRPDAEQTYDARIAVVYSPCQDDTVIVPLHGIGSSGAPVIDSDSAITVSEDETRPYIAAAHDPEGQPLQITIVDYPPYATWDSNTPDSLSIHPLEGDTDSNFRILASDGFLETEQTVAVHVIPVNDAPELEKMNRRTHAFEDVSTLETLTAGELLEFTLWAHDPEDSLIQIDYLSHNLPSPPEWKAHPDRNKRIFSWPSLFGDEGSYRIVFRATDNEMPSPMSVTDTAYIEVNRALPDLRIEELRPLDGHARVYKGKEKTFEVTVLNTDAPAALPFKLFMSGMSTIEPSEPVVIPGLQRDERVTHSFTVTFNRAGHIPLCAVIDYEYEVEELDETNNEACVPVTVDEGELQVYPNPFTPNQDHYNDRAGFDISELTISRPNIKIFSFSGFLVRSLDVVNHNIIEWDGRDSGGKEMPPGVYLYVLYNGDSKEASGSIVLAR